MSCRGRHPLHAGYWIIRGEDRASRCLERSRHGVTAKNSTDDDENDLLLIQCWYHVVSKDDEVCWERRNDFRRCCRVQVER